MPAAKVGLSGLKILPGHPGKDAYRPPARYHSLWISMIFTFKITIIIPVQPGPSPAQFKREENFSVPIEVVRLQLVVRHRIMRPEDPSHLRVVMEVYVLFV